MRHCSVILVAGFTASALAGCASPPLAPGAGNEPAALTRQASPTIATNMGPFVAGSGCSMEFSGFYASAAFDVNADGVAVGSTSCVAGEYLTFRWSELEGMEQLAGFAGGYAIIGGESINRSGTIAGVLLGWSTVPETASRPVLWTAANARIDLVPAAPCDPPHPWCSTAETGHYVNDRGVVAGTYVEGAYRWTAATGLVNLPGLGARVPTAINSRGDIVAAQSGGGSAALLRRSGRLQEIPGIWPTGLNNRREIVGYSGAWPSASAVLWTRGRGVQPLGTLGGTLSVAYDVNERGEVVGASTNAAGEMRAFYWTKARGMVDLGPGIAYAINDAGHMVGTAPSGLFPPDLGGGELWQGVLWRGTAGVQAAAVAGRMGGGATARASDCFGDERNWRSKSRMLRCIAEQ